MSTPPSEPQQYPTKRADSSTPAQPEEKERPSDHRSIVQVSAESHSGMLPHPAILERYEILKPGITGDLLDMTKRDLDHQHSMDRSEYHLRKRAVLGNILNTRLGTLSSLIVTLSAFGLVYLLISGGHTIAGLVPLLIPLSILANIFLTKDSRSPSDSADAQDES